MKKLLPLLLVLAYTIPIHAQVPVRLKAIGVSPDAAWQVMNNDLYFSAGGALWRSDGTRAGTYLVKKLIPSGDLVPENFILHNGKLLFTAHDANETRFYTSDGTLAGTDYYSSIFNFIGENARAFFEYNGNVFFQANESLSHNILLFKTDGSTSVAPLSTNIALSYVKTTTIINGKLYFGGGSLAGGQANIDDELLVSDGTTAGTQMVKQISMVQTAVPHNLIPYTSGEFFFCADDGVHGIELWQSDGTEVGTKMFIDINPIYLASSSPKGFHEMNGLIYFFADDGVHGFEPWVTDGTTTGTHMIKDINPAASGAVGSEYVQLGSKLLFVAETSTLGKELWVTDGTAAGTVLLKDIAAGAGSGVDIIFGRNKVGDSLFFAGNDDTTGLELWVTDGTAAGTRLVYDLYPGTVGSIHVISNLNIITANSKVYYIATDGNGVFDLWRLDDPSNVSEVAALANDISIYPNPTTGLVTIQTNGKILQAEVYNAMGQLLLATQVNNATINLQNYPDGIYYIRLKDEEKAVSTQRIVLAR